LADLKLGVEMPFVKDRIRLYRETASKKHPPEINRLFSGWRIFEREDNASLIIHPIPREDICQMKIS